MSQKTSNIIFNIIAIALVAGLVYFSFSKKTEDMRNQPPVTNSTSTPANLTVEYKNNQYGFTISLPNSWKNFSVITDEWEGYALDNQGQEQIINEKGPLVSIRHPDWDYKSPRQDIPVMVFTLKQWNDLQQDKFHIGAAPIGPSELGRNAKYVFALPARYNYAFLTGYEEVDQIIQSKSLHTF